MALAEDMDSYEVLLRSSVMASAETRMKAKAMLEKSEKGAHAAVMECRMHINHLYDQLATTQEFIAAMLSEMNKKMINLGDVTATALETIHKQLDELEE